MAMRMGLRTETTPAFVAMKQDCMECDVQTLPENRSGKCKGKFAGVAMKLAIGNTKQDSVYSYDLPRQWRKRQPVLSLWLDTLPVIWVIMREHYQQLDMRTASVRLAMNSRSPFSLRVRARDRLMSAMIRHKP